MEDQKCSDQMKRAFNLGKPVLMNVIVFNGKGTPVGKKDHRRDIRGFTSLSSIQATLLAGISNTVLSYCVAIKYSAFKTQKESELILKRNQSVSV
ncbi:hypothetical protein CEXT_432611 [Caerostris extrusa]|uniref:Uncharacterized protein n=1 Tax=Caerostris extrusa TaxID=172846 RepID=A0AAV4UC95_CAEEX|nr:hypothetical protein CEXT_432611 [Caerostris extrusa]